MPRRLVDVLKEALEGAPEVKEVDLAVQMVEGGRPKDALVVRTIDGRTYQVQVREMLS